tara:strand:- start:1474 stop:1809 length:336 start_codon:yes stop_codon:yes gene_type:complete
MQANDYDSDNEDYYADFDEEVLRELEENRKFNVLYNFKKLIQKEPEFTAIDNISAFEILSAMNSGKQIVNSCIEPNILDFFDDLYIEIKGVKGNKYQYAYVCNEIFKKIYV